MAAPIDIIKEYLVGLGFQVDQNSFNKIQQTIKDLGKLVEIKTAGMS